MKQIEILQRHNDFQQKHIKHLEKHIEHLKKHASNMTSIPKELIKQS